MNFSDYQDDVARTMNGEGDALVNFTLGLAGEVGEFVELVKKHRFHGKDLPWELTDNELGDICWYVDALCNTLNLSLKSVLEANVRKLRARYPDGFVKGGGER